MEFQKHKTPELLLPAGKVENFRAAVKGGANAVYLGLKQFNARARASNFSHFEFLSVLEEAKEHNVKVYVTLNTVIKNEELPALLDFLWFLSKTKIDAVIIQDWGVYYLIKKHFAQLSVHASTQMGYHNSLATDYAFEKQIDRVILARELTQQELITIGEKTKVELEIFVHGALCYSFSGMCLFSSYLGGAGANRGLCAQPRRRAYGKSNQPYVFSLKDNQLIEQIEILKKMNISSLKIEGRLKSAEYVYNTALSYRKAIDKSKYTLPLVDFGREKTSYFFGGNIQKAITERPNTGILIGSIQTISHNTIIILLNQSIKIGDKIRFVHRSEQINLTTDHTCKTEDNLLICPLIDSKLKIGDEVFLIGKADSLSFSNKIKKPKHIPSLQMPKPLKDKILKSFNSNLTKQTEQVFFRIDRLEWLEIVTKARVQHLILKLSKNDWTKVDLFKSKLQNLQGKIWIELPKFIAEGQIEFYKQLVADLHSIGIRQFSLSHASQKTLMLPNSIWAFNENVYVFNDAASQFLKHEKAVYFTYPQEIDFGNLYALKNRKGLLPIHFYPELFYSRMPVKVEEVNDSINDEHGKTYHKIVNDGITIVRPDEVVSQFKFLTKLRKLGYHQFLIDLSYHEANRTVFEAIIKAFQKQEKLQGSTHFNLKGVLK
ncbi:MAG: U32 family peptidase [Bacteroidales bacterium]|nr:U32 family peptidase [Bacteroidales bacterium]